MTPITSNSTPRAERSIPLVVCDLLLVLALIALPLAWFFDPWQGAWGRVSWGWKPVLTPLGILVLRTLLKNKLGAAGTPVRGWAEARLFKKLAFAGLMTFGFFAGTEALLGVLGVEKTAGVPIVIRGEEDQDTKLKKGDNKVIMDPELLWRFNPGVHWGGVRINEHGYRTRSFSTNKAPGTRRVIALGDSCTAQGEPPYSDRLHALLQTQPPTTQSWEAFNLGVFGYSSEQGYRQFKSKGPGLQPDVVTIYYGWNDHWLYEKTDRKRLATRMSPRRAAMVQAIQKKRLFTVLTQHGRPTEKAHGKNDRYFRVPQTNYEENLVSLVTLVREMGAQPLLITAARRDLTPSIVKSGHADDTEAAEKVHDEYVGITRSVAERMQVPVLDLARDFADPEYDAYFSKDGIHFEGPGLQAIAERLNAKLKELADQGQLPAH
jgi:lysophospholipase L1-like esterase